MQDVVFVFYVLVFNYNMCLKIKFQVKIYKGKLYYFLILNMYIFLIIERVLIIFSSFFR